MKEYIRVAELFAYSTLRIPSIAAGGSLTLAQELMIVGDKLFLRNNHSLRFERDDAH